MPNNLPRATHWIINGTAKKTGYYGHVAKNGNTVTLLEGPRKGERRSYRARRWEKIPIKIPMPPPNQQPNGGGTYPTRKRHTKRKQTYRRRR
jgi:hypothetical protein